jgi:hypothetical protein
MNRRHSVILLCILLSASFFTPGCSRDENRAAAERILIRAGGSSVTVREFHEAFESGITSPSVMYSDMEALRDERYRTLNRLTEELIILERARELELAIGDEELARGVADLKKDFPDDTFEETLIENGISYMVWEKGLKRRLLMEKVIRQDVSATSFQVPLPANDTAATAMDANFEAQIPVDTKNTESIRPENGPDTEAAKSGDTAEAGNSAENAQTDTSHPIPENKAESEYDKWITGLKERYPIEIDWKLWEEIEQEDAGGM